MTPAFGPTALTPQRFLDRSRVVFADRPAYRDDELALTYAELGERVDHLAGALRGMGIDRGDVVSVLAPNTNVMLESHFGVLGAGAVLNTLNTRLAPNELRYIVGHAGARVLIADVLFAELAGQACPPGTRLLIAGDEDDEYEQLLAAAPAYRHELEDEWELLSLNYTSGTTGKPKGVMYGHRGAYLQALAMVHHAELTPGSVFLWTLPMFHCNGWCFPWAVTAAGGTHVGLRGVDPSAIWRELRTGGVTHFNAAPTVLTDLVHATEALDGPLPNPVRVATGGAPPSPALLERLDALNVDVTHLYGLTETYGPAAICQWRREWNDLDVGARARLRARQGVGNVVSCNVRVVDPEGDDVPADAATIGEVVLRGDNVMLGYYRDDEATASATVDGWFRTGDLAVMYPDHYIELRDRAKDIIISGGENIASVEVEQALDSHPAVQQSAVVGAPDDHWGEIVVAFVTPVRGADPSEDELITHVRDQIARYKAPKRIIFGKLPTTSTGKVQKFLLRERARRLIPREGGPTGLSSR